MNSDYTGICKLLYDWQTIIAGTFAIAAAIIAACPVWRQLKVIRVQMELAARETLTNRLSAMESRRGKAQELMRSITTEFMARLHPNPYYDDNEKPDINSEWACTAGGIVDRVIDTFTLQQEASFDGQLIDTERKAVILQCEALSDCLYKIHIPDSCDSSGPDYNLTEEQEAELIMESKQAETNLEDCISATKKSGDDLDAAFKTGLEQIRDRIRRVDVLLTLN